MNVLLLDNYDSFTYNLAQLLKESSLCSFEVVKNDKITVNKAKQFDKIMLSPGPGVPKEAGNMLEIIELFHKAKPIFGVCLGMQAIAEFFGGEIYNLKKVYHGIQKEIYIKYDKIFNGLNNKIKVGLYHSWAVTIDKLPHDISVSAISEDNIVMALFHNLYNVRGVQFHPESYMTPNGQQIINNWLLF